jgi:replication factor C large subunit
MFTLWTEKHKPRSLSDVVGNKKAIEKLVEWARSWSKGVPKKRAAFLYGPPGVGKTVSVWAFAKDFDMELVEKNASDYRTEKVIRLFAGLASQYGTLFGKKRLILLDELDGIEGKADRGGVRAISEIVKKTRSPIVLIANNAYDPRFSNLRNHCLLIQFKKPSIAEVAKRLEEICAWEGIETDARLLRFLAERSGRDVRSAVNDLQALGQGRKKLTYEDLNRLAFRDRKETIFEVLRLIFYSKRARDAKRALGMADVDTDMLFEWIYENIPHQLTHPQDLARAMGALAKADLYRGRIRSTRNWKLFRYVVDFMTAGVAMAREKTKPRWAPFRFPERIRTLSRTRRTRQLRSQIGLKIKRRCHTSSLRAVREVLPYLKVIFENNAEMAAGIARWLDLDSSMIEYLAEDGVLAKEIITKAR